MDIELDDSTRATRLISAWIEAQRIFLRDGSPYGLHPRAKEALLAALVQSYNDLRQSLPPATTRGAPAPSTPAPVSTKRKPSRPGAKAEAK